MKHQNNQIAVLKALIEASGDDFNTYLCTIGSDATEMRRLGIQEAEIERNIDTTIGNKVLDLIDELRMEQAA